MINKIALSTKTFDFNGNVFMPFVNETGSRFQDYRRRLTRTATLDTGAFIDDRGYFDGDRTIDILLNGSKSFFDSLLYLTQNYSSMWIYLPDGVFNGNIQRLVQDGGTIQLSILLQSKAST